ncbi:MAG TPA: hypothetical protein DIC59_06810 [Candidatus Competibacteraceae bacterium]|nr:hypothetical protein [Candidatus Competibacteraceae bacterium]
MANTKTALEDSIASQPAEPPLPIPAPLEYPSEDIALGRAYEADSLAQVPTAPPALAPEAVEFTSDAVEQVEILATPAPIAEATYADLVPSSDLAASIEPAEKTDTGPALLADDTAPPSEPDAIIEAIAAAHEAKFLEPDVIEPSPVETELASVSPVTAESAPENKPAS